MHGLGEHIFNDCKKFIPSKENEFETATPKKNIETQLKKEKKK